MLCQTLSQTLKLAPHESPSTQPLTKNPQQLCYFLCQTLTKDPQQVWQTLKNFDYPDDLHQIYTSHVFRVPVQNLGSSEKGCPENRLYPKNLSMKRGTHQLFFLPNPHERPSTSLANPQELWLYRKNPELALWISHALLDIYLLFLANIIICLPIVKINH